MAELTVFTYRTGRSTLHQLDIRSKVFILFLINLFSLQASPQALIPLTLLLTIVFLGQKIPLLSTLRQTRLFFLLVVFVILSRAIFTEGEVLASFSYLSLTREGVTSGLVYGWRLILVLICGILFISSSKTSEIKAAIQWYLKPLPFVPEKRMAIMISLMIRFLPLILDQGREISDAQKSRGIERIKNPVKRLSLFTISLMRRIIDMADKLILAMEARCFTEDRTDPELHFTRKDLIISLGTTLFLLLFWLANLETVRQVLTNYRAILY